MKRLSVNAQQRRSYLRHVSKWLRHRIYELDQFECVYCGIDMSPLHVRSLVSLDHYHSLASEMFTKTRVQVNSVENLFTCCLRCNQQNQNKITSDKMNPTFGRFRP